MPIEFRAGTEADLPAIVGLLRAAFAAEPDAPFLNLDLLRWKYYETRPDWAGSRSYVMVQDGAVVAHGCAWPVSDRAICLIDWVSAKASAGAGIMLARRMQQLAPVVLSIGGSKMTQQIMPKIGFVPQGLVESYGRVLRPWRQFLQRPGDQGVKGIARLVRNLAWSLSPGALPEGWSLARKNEPDYLTRCPGAEVSRYDLVADGRKRGECVVSRVGPQVRLASIAADALTPAIAAVGQSVAASPEACELIGLADNGLARAAFLANGFREREARKLFVYGPKEAVPPIDMLADDMFYLNVPAHPFLT